MLIISIAQRPPSPTNYKDSIKYAVFSLYRSERSALSICRIAAMLQHTKISSSGMPHDTNRGNFNGILFGLFQLISILSIIPGGRPVLKGITFVVLSWISYHLITKTTTQNLVIDFGMGSGILHQLVIVFDMIFITHPDTFKKFPRFIW